MKKYSEISVNYLFELFEHTEGELIWKSRPVDHFLEVRHFKRWNCLYAGSRAGVENGRGYLGVTVTIKGVKTYLLAHRIILAMTTGEWPSGEVDHVDHDRKNNLIGNLRVVSRKENNRNKSIYKSNKSGVTGVYFNKDKNMWRAQGRANGKSLNLGDFKHLGDAIGARKTYLEKERHHENHGK